ncbi:MAG TPA: cytochrome C [Campylobacterales bacterium]|nr:cytochrome C [Campylobacterales bacterium]
MRKIYILASIALSLSAGGLKVEPVTDREMVQACEKCHFVYQAEFLPERSWERLFTEQNLKNHFGDEVKLSSSLREKFLDYYLNNASDSKDTKYRRKINRSIPLNSTPIRVSRVPYIHSKHEDLPKEMFLDNPKVGSYSKCNSCHDAKKGIYDEDEVHVPGWDKGFFTGWHRIDD